MDDREGQKGFRPAHDINFNIQQMEQKQAQVRNRINEAFYKNLFQAIVNNEGDPRRTATEILEIKNEKLLSLGPVLEQLNQDVLDPFIDIVFNIMNSQGLIPRAPEELHGVALRVEYISILAQAQKSLGISSIERFTSFVNNVGAVVPQVMDKVDMDQLIDVYSELTGVPPKIVRPDDQVAGIRQERAKQQQAQQQAEMIAQGSMAAKNLGQADTSGKNALTDLLQQSQAGSLT